MRADRQGKEASQGSPVGLGRQASQATRAGPGSLARPVVGKPVPVALAVVATQVAQDRQSVEVAVAQAVPAPVPEAAAAQPPSVRQAKRVSSDPAAVAACSRSPATTPAIGTPRSASMRACAHRATIKTSPAATAERAPATARTRASGARTKPAPERACARRARSKTASAQATARSRPAASNARVKATASGDRADSRVRRNATGTPATPGTAAVRALGSGAWHRASGAPIARPAVRVAASIAGLKATPRPGPALLDR